MCEDRERETRTHAQQNPTIPEYSAICSIYIFFSPKIYFSNFYKIKRNKSSPPWKSDLCVPDYQSAQDVEDMFVWYKKKKAWGDLSFFFGKILRLCTLLLVWTDLLIIQKSIWFYYFIDSFFILTWNIYYVKSLIYVSPYSQC